MRSSPLKTFAWLLSLLLVRSAMAVQPAITNPAPGSTLTNSSATFQWSSGTGVTAYAFAVGSSPGGYDLFNQNENTNLSVTVTNLPMDGRTLYVTLSWLASGGWQSTNCTYTAAGASTPMPQMISPTPNSTLTNTSATFQWTYGVGAMKYYLAIGSSPGATNIYYQNQNLNSSATVNGLPTNGLPLYVQLSWLTSGGWQFTNYTYAMAGTNTPTPQMASPAPGSTLTNPTATFQWTYGVDALKYYLSIGNSPGATNIFYQNANLNSSVTATNLPANGQTLCVQLSWLTAGGWQSTNYTYTVAGTNTPTPQMISPAPNSTLTNTSVVFQWTYGVDATKYYLSVGSSPGGTDLFSANENLNSSAVVGGLPTNGMAIYMQLSWLTAGGWQSTNYTYAMAGTSGPVPTMGSPAPGSTLPSSTATFQWTYGAGVTEYYLTVGNAPGGTNFYSQNAQLNSSATVSRLPTNGMTIYVRLSWLTSGWQSTDYVYQAVTTLRAVGQGTNIIISWPTNDPGYSLQYATNLPASNWFSNSISPAILNGRYTVTNGTLNPFTIFRLAK